MKPAFWDTSALVPLCVDQPSSAAVRQLLEQYEILVWWGTAVEMRSALERLLRTGYLKSAEYAVAGRRLDRLRGSWRELQPTEALRDQAETFLMGHALKAGDALQLAAAWTWCSGETSSCVVLSGDAQLLEAARQAGFDVVAV